MHFPPRRDLIWRGIALFLAFVALQCGNHQAVADDTGAEAETNTPLVQFKVPRAQKPPALKGKIQTDDWKDALKVTRLTHALVPAYADGQLRRWIVTKPAVKPCDRSVTLVNQQASADDPPPAAPTERAPDNNAQESPAHLDFQPVYPQFALDLVTFDRDTEILTFQGDARHAALPENEKAVTITYRVQDPTRGDPENTAIDPLDDAGSEAKITFKPQRGRVDIAIFAYNGVYWSAPAIISCKFMPNPTE